MNSIIESPARSAMASGGSPHKPRKTVVPLEIAQGWSDDGQHVYQQKLDGKFATWTGGGNILAGEKMPDGRGWPENFVAFDILKYDWQDVAREPLRQRAPLLDKICHIAGLRRVPHLPRGTSPGDWLQSILDDGGEGIVRKGINATWFDTMEAAKRLETWICRVRRIGMGKQSAEIERLVEPVALRPDTGGLPSEGLPVAARPGPPFGGQWSPCGSVSLFGGKCDQVRAGSIIKVEGFGLTSAGKIREPRPCKDTAISWLIKY